MEIYLRNLLPTWKGLGKLETDFAKDNAHPIPLHHVLHGLIKLKT